MIKPNGQDMNVKNPKPSAPQNLLSRIKGTKINTKNSRVVSRIHNILQHLKQLEIYSIPHYTLYAHSQQDVLGEAEGTRDKSNQGQH